MVSTLFRDPLARSSALAALGTLQPRAFGSLNRVETLDSVSNYCVYLCGDSMQPTANISCWREKIQAATKELNSGPLPEL